MAHITVVSTEFVGLSSTLKTLRNAGYEVSGVSTFEEARRFLAGHATDLVIADERLGPFNALHMILTARASNRRLRAIVTAPAPSAGLEADARSFSVTCSTKPADPAEWLQHPELRRLRRRRNRVRRDRRPQLAVASTAA